MNEAAPQQLLRAGHRQRQCQAARTYLSMTSIFETHRFVDRDPSGNELPWLHALFDSTAAYFFIGSGKLPRPDEAAESFGLPDMQRLATANVQTAN